MRKLLLPFLLLIVACGLNPKPKPPASCPDACPLGSACTDPNKGCEPIPAPGPVCEGQTYGCWHWPPDSRTWLYACPVYDSSGGVIGVLNVVGVGGPAQCPVKPEPPVPPEPPKPPTGKCPFSYLDYPGAKLSANTKYWGQGLDHTTLVVGSAKYCTDRGWTDGRSSCQVAIDGDPNKVVCEIEAGGGCPRFEFRASGVQHACVDDQNDVMSCDHFGNPEFRDDPQTPTTGTTVATLKGFEGQPQECGLQRIGDKPIAGFFSIAHGAGEVRSCVDSTFTACGPWLAVNH